MDQETTDEVSAVPIEDPLADADTGGSSSGLTQVSYCTKYLLSSTLGLTLD